MNYCNYYHADLDLTVSLKHHSVLCQLLKQHASKWKTIGQYLGFLPGELDNIEAKPLLLKNAPEAWLECMLLKFLEGQLEQRCHVTLKSIITALKKANLGGVASDIVEKFRPLSKYTCMHKA